MDTKEQKEGRLRSAVSSTENSSSRDDAQYEEEEEEEEFPSSQSSADRSVGSGGYCGPSESSSAPSTAEDIVSRGIASVLGPVVRNFDSSVDGVMSSQKALSRSIDRLTQELDKQLEDAPLPLVVQHAAKLSGLRKRVQFLTHTLHVVKARIANMDRLISERGDSQPYLMDVRRFFIVQQFLNVVPLPPCSYSTLCSKCFKSSVSSQKS
jgi:hypothetical protein